MGKRSNFRRMKGDYYITPESAVLPLLPYLPYGTMFAEPCAGNGALVDKLEKHGMSCLQMADIDPKRNDIERRDALGDIDTSVGWYEDSCDFIITNPPWSRPLLHPMISEFAGEKPTWLLFDADWMHTIQANPYLKFCHKIVSVGRASWMGNGVSGMDNAAWYLFDKSTPVIAELPAFVGRAA